MPHAPRFPALASRILSEIPDDALLRDQQGRAYAQVPEDGRRLLLPLRGRDFLLWLRRRSFALSGALLGDSQLARISGLLEAKARRAPRAPLWNRVARDPDGAIWIDLGDDDGQAVRVSAAGFTVVARPPCLFRRYSHQLALPRPGDSGCPRWGCSCAPSAIPGRAGSAAGWCARARTPEGRIRSPTLTTTSAFRTERGYDRVNPPGASARTYLATDETGKPPARSRPSPSTATATPGRGARGAGPALRRPGHRAARPAPGVPPG